MDQAIISLDIKEAVAGLKTCAISGSFDCHCKTVQCDKCGKDSPLCRTTCRVEQIKSWHFIERYTGECCLGGTIEEYVDYFYKANPSY